MLIEARKQNHGEEAIHLIFYFDPKHMRRLQQEQGDEGLKALAAALVDGQFQMSRQRVLDAIHGYVDVEQAKLDKTAQ